MELQFQKTAIPCLRFVTAQVQNQEQTQEVRLTDGMPDIGHVLASWGQVLIRGKEWRGSGMSVTGGVMAWVLYQPEDGSSPQWLETWIPFQVKWDFTDTERDGTICVRPLLHSVDVRSTSARKIMVRAGISILGEAVVNDEAEVYAADSVPEDICLLKNTYPLLLPKEAGEKAFVIDEVLSLPPSAPQPEKLIRYGVQPVLVEQKVMADKVIFRGTANLHLLYLGVDGQLHSWDFEMPFSQYAQLEHDYEPEAVSVVCLAVTSLELDRAEDGSYGWKTGVLGQYMIYERTMVDTVEDAYSNRRSVVPQVMALTVPSVVDTQSELRRPEEKLELNGIRVVDASFYPEHPRLYREGEQVVTEFSGMFQLLGYDESGELTSATKRWDEAIQIQAAPMLKLQAYLEPDGKVECAVDASGAVLSAQLPVTVMAVSTRGIPMTSGLEIGEASEPDPGRPSLILRRTGEEGLWELAKQSGSTVDAIQKANKLQQEPPLGQMLLIPVE